jgi:hypothetical protein
VEALEDVADCTVAQGGDPVLIQAAEINAIQPIVTIAGPVQASEKVEQGALSGSRGAHDCDHLTALDSNADIR